MHSLTSLIAVPCHAVIHQGIFYGPFPEDARYYIEHLAAAAHLAARSPRTLLIPTGGMTSKEAGMLSEGATNLALAAAHDFWGHPELHSRAIAEEYALTSLDNLLYGIAMFRLHTGAMPEHVTMVGWKFKEERFRMHAEAIGWPDIRFTYVGVNNPEGKALEQAVQSESRLVAEVRADPLMLGPGFTAKRAARNPFRRTHPYRGLGPALDAIFNLL